MNKIKVCLFSLLTMSVALATSSCIKDKTDDCGIAIRFVYDHNILSVNALESQADQLTLYVFDSDGTLVQQYTNGTTPLTNSFSVQINDLRAGSYRFAAWAQSTNIAGDEAYFTIPELTIGVSSIEDLTYFMKRNSGIQQHELNNLLVGVTEASINPAGRSQTITVSLRKVNNRVRVIMIPYTSDFNIDVNDYTISIVDRVGNGHINYDYSLLPDEQITYLPYYAANVTPQDSEQLPPGEVDRAAVVEISTSRLMEVNAPRLIIVRRSDNTEIFSVNLPWFLSLTGMENHREWSLQEYLDRQDEYSITLFFGSGGWMNAAIIINGWIINDIVIGL